MPIFDPEELPATPAAPFDPPAMKPAAAPAKPVVLRGFDDVDAARQAVFDNVRDGYATKRVENKQHVLEFADVDYQDRTPYRRRDEKDALLGRKRLYWTLQGRMRLIDKATGQVISEDAKPRPLAQVPYLTGRGTFIHNGSSYVVVNQQRLRPGVYTRETKDGSIESQFNVRPGTGRGFRINMDPATGVFRMQAEHAQVKLYPVLKALGVDDRRLNEMWGPDLLHKNKLEDDKTPGVSLAKMIAKLGNPADQELPAEKRAARLRELVERMELDPETTTRTLGQAHERASPDTILQATQKILKIAKREQDSDERDDIPFQSFHSAEDFFREHIDKDAGKWLRQALWKAGYKKDVASIPANYFNRQLHSVLLGSGVAAASSEINPIELLNSRYKVTRMGEGGIGSTDAVPKDARGIQPSHFGFLDFLVAPESQKIGLDLRVAQGVMRGSDGKLYQKFLNAKTGELETLHTGQTVDKVIAFPGELRRGEKLVRAMVKGKIRQVPVDKVDYELPHPTSMLTPVTNMVPLISGMKGQRAIMAARMSSQALALEKAEAPLVQTKRADGEEGMERQYAELAGAVFSRKPGTVTKVDRDGITVTHDDGSEETYDLYDHLKLNQKSFMHNTPVVQPGQRVDAGTLLAPSNFTDQKGNISIGTNLRTAYYMADGMTHEDAVVISESAAKKLSSMQMYDFEAERGERIHDIGKSSFISKYPGVFKREQLDRLDDNGVIKPGTIVNPGDPLVLAVGKRTAAVKGTLTRSAKSVFSDESQVWEHERPGEVVDVHKTGKGWRVTVKSFTPSRIADKLSARFGNKGVISRVIPDSEMPHTADGKPLEVLMNPAGVVGRVNPAVLAEMALGKVARKTGKPYILDGFQEESLAKLAMQELQKHGLSDTETVIDPKTGRKLKDIFVGDSFVMKLHHLAESKMDARSTGDYTSDDLPAKGSGGGGAKRMGFLESMALLSHGATGFLEDAKLIRGQRNDEFWRLYKLGMNPPMPEVSKPYQKLETTLKAAGVSLRKSGTKTQVLPMTNSEIAELTADREITEADTVDFDSGEPIPGGLFDLAKTGGDNGTKWAHIKLKEPVPNPIMEEPIKLLLGLGRDEFRAVVSGQQAVRGLKGGAGIREALKRMDLDKEIAATKEAIKTGKRSGRDKAVKRLGVLETLKRNQLDPSDLVWDRVPVIPPKFRPVARFEGVELIADANQLYKDLMEANKNVELHRQEFGEHGEQAASLYDAVKAVTGLGQPVAVETQERGARGLLKQVFGNQPKTGLWQRKTIGSSLDLVGRGVIAPDVDLDLDEIGLPADMAWTMYKPFVIRRMVKAGSPATQALKDWEARSPTATKALEAELKARPVVMNRAPSLHKFNLTGAWPKIVSGNALRTPIGPLTGWAGDYDGDALNVHVPVSDKAVQDVVERMLPSKNLIQPKNYGVHILPPHGFQVGLYLGSQVNKGKMPRTFKTKADVIRAYKSGELDADDPVVILDS